MIDALKKKTDKLIILLWIAVVLASIKSILTDTGFDNAYTVAMSYRHLNGDAMFQQMWEPHQTSIFFTDFCMWLYHLVVPSYTGVMLYLQICGTAFFGGLCVLIYRMLKPLAGKQLANLACIFFFMFRAKQTPFPDFANLQIGFSVCVLYFLVRFLQNQGKYRYLVITGVFLCLQVLSYPSCVLVYVPVVIMLLLKAEKKWISIGIFTGTCGLIGIVYVGYFLIKIGIPQFLENISHIFYSDSHSGEFISTYTYFYGFVIALLWLVIGLGLAALVCFVGTKLRGKKQELLPVYGLILLVSEVVFLFTQKKTGIDWTCTFYSIPLLLMIIGVFGYRKMEEQEKVIWLAGILLSAGSFLATFLLTDLGLITMVAYMVLGGVVSFLPIRHCKGEAIVFLMAVCALTTIHRGLVVWGYANKDSVYMVTDLRKMITAGPSLGVLCDYMTCYLSMADLEDHNQFVNAEDKLFLVGGQIMDSMEYLLSDAQISNYSTIDTPIYNEEMLEYFRLNPEKTPTVIAVSCWYGEMMVDPDSWVMNWIDENYEVVGDGRYWRYYRLTQPLG